MRRRPAQPQFAHVTVSPQNFRRLDGSGFWIQATEAINRMAVAAANLVTPAAWSGSVVHAMPVSYQSPSAMAPNNIGVQITPSVVIP